MIGGSFALGIKKNKLAKQIWGLDVDKKALDFAVKTKLINDYLILDGKNEIKLESMICFDLVIIACPLSKYAIVFDKIIPKISNSKTIISDLGSLKNFIFDLNLAKNVADSFIATHPIAGSQKIGVKNAIPDLFAGRKLIICKESLEKNNEALKKITIVWEKLGANIVYLNAKEHDKIYGLVSHLPQLLSFVIKENFSLYFKSDDKILSKAYRLGDSDYKIWSDIFSLNKKNLEFFLKKLVKNIEALEKQLDCCDNLNWLSKVTNNFALKEIENYPKLKNIESDFENFLLHVVLISAFLQIKEIKSFNDYIGRGFEDFILPVIIFRKLNQELTMTKLFAKNKISILKNCKKLKIIIAKFYAK